MLQDLRFALRMLVKERWYTAVAVLALALGMGVNATVFTLVNAVLIRGLPFRDSGSLYMVALKPQRGQRAGVSYPDLADWRAQSRTFTGLAAYSNASMNISDDRGGLPEQARGAWLTANAFGVLGQPPLLGRDFGPEDERKGTEPAVIIGYSIWKNRYGGDPNILGRVIRVNGRPSTIVGVMPENMKFPNNTELWGAFVPTPEQDKRSWRGLSVFGRMRGGGTRKQAQAELDGIAAQLAAQYPDTNKEFSGAVIETFNERFNGGQIRTVFLSLMGAVGFVLLIACANVANLLLSRSAHRTREIAVRVAMGASRWRVIRQLLIESILLGFIGGAIGLLLAVFGVRMFDAAVADTGKPYWIVFSIDYVVFAFLASICVVTGIVFGLAPALQVSKTNVNEVLKESGRGNAGGRRARWLSGTMVVVELAATIVLLVGAGLMVRSFLKLYTIDIGIRTDNVMAMRMQLPDTKYSTPEARRAFFERLEPRLQAIPGAEAVAVTTSVPPFGTGRRHVEIEGRPARKPEDDPLQVSTVTISPGFFDVVGVQLRRGRKFHEADGAAGSETIIVNEKLAAQFFPGEDPIGKRIRFPQNAPPPGQQPPAAQTPPAWRTIVGICPPIRHSSPQDADPPAVAYLPYRQDPPLGSTLLIRSRLDAASMMNVVRREVQAVDPDQPVFTVQTMDQMLAQARWPYRVFGGLFALFAFIALLLSAMGLYAVMAYSVTQRTQEIGVRMALGAVGRQVSWLILKRGLTQLGLGLSIGLVGAFALSRVLSSLLVQVTPTDPVTFVAITGLLMAVAVAACLIPARRATRVDPLVALRAE
jgi:predicted permease